MTTANERIWEAADRLVASGVKPTLNEVRKALGGGSFSTISEAMSEWRKRREATAEAARVPLPEPIAQRLAEFGAEIWAVALQAASAQFAVERQALDTERREWEATLADTAQAADHVGRELEVAQHSVATLEAALESERARATSSAQEAVAHRLEATAVGARAAELERHVADLRTELLRAHERMRELIEVKAGTRPEDTAVRG